MSGEDPAYLAWIREQPCAVLGEDCEGRIEAHHTGQRGLGQRAHDHSAIPLCMYHHRAWHSASGPFRSWNKEMRREWALNTCAAMRRGAAA